MSHRIPLHDTLGALTSFWHRLHVQYQQEHLKGGFSRADPRTTAWQTWSTQWLHDLKNLGETAQLYEGGSPASPYHTAREAVLNLHKQLALMADLYFEVLINDRSLSDPDLQRAEHLIQYVLGDAITQLGQPDNIPSPVKVETVKPTAVVTSPVVNIRNGPGMNHEAIQQLKKDAVLDLLGEQGEWFQVQLGGGRTGWVHRNVTSKRAQGDGSTDAIKRVEVKSSSMERRSQLRLEPIRLLSIPVEFIPEIWIQGNGLLSGPLSTIGRASIHKGRWAMEQTREEIDQNLAERLCWQAAHRDDSRVARRLYRKQVVDGVYPWDAGALLDDLFYVLQELGVGDWLGKVQGTAVQREMVPFVQYVLLYSLKTLCGIKSMHALPTLLFSAEALRRLVGCNAHQVRHGVCQRGAAHRQGPRTRGPICPEALAENIVKLNLRDLEAVLNRVIRALAQAGVLTAKVTGIVDATDLETTAQYAGCGQVTRQRRITDKRGKVHEIEVTVYGWKLIVLIEARTKIPLAATVVPIHEHETLSLRALITQARTNLAGHVRLHKVVFDRGFLDGVDLWWLEQHGITVVVPAKATMAVTIDAQAQAAAGEGITVGHRAHTVRHGQGTTAWSERLETEVVGITGLTTDDQYGTPEHGHHHNRRDFHPNPINAVVVRQWHGRDYGPGGTTVFLTNAPVDTPLQPCDDDDDRRLIEHCYIKESKPQWSVKHPPQKTARAVHVHVLFTLLLFALGTAYRLPCAQEATGREPVGWQRWRRQLLEHTRDHVIVFAQDCYGIVHMAEYSRLLGVRLKDVPPGIGTHQEILAKYRLAAHG